MPYDRNVERSHPTLIQMILDDSGSMKLPMPGSPKPRHEWVETYAAMILTELLARCTELMASGPVIRPRYFLDVIKYGSHPEPWSTEELDIGAAAKQFGAQKSSFGLGGKLEGTDTSEAFRVAHDRLQAMINKPTFRDSFPPMVFHLTDGESQTDASASAQKMMALSTSDGNALVVNAYIGTQTNLTYTGPADFTGYVAESEVGPNEDNLRLFRMSSVMPETIRQNLVNDKIFPNIRAGARLFFDVRTHLMLQKVLAVVGSLGSRTRT
jgi:hypothetical protein